MDDTPIDDLVADLESADPADAPDIADAVADRLSRDLEDETDQDGDGAETPA